MPARFRKTSASSYLGWVSLPGIGRPIRHESSLERDFLHSAAFLPGLVRLEEQPVRIEGAEHHYTPDFNLELRAQQHPNWGFEYTHLLEVKPFRVLAHDWKDLEPRMMLGLEFARAHNWVFKILTDREIRSQDLVPLQFLRRYLDRSPTPELVSWLSETLLRGPLTLLELLSRVRGSLGMGPCQVLPTIWNLVAVRAVVVSGPPVLDYSCLLCHPEATKGTVWVPGSCLLEALMAPWEVRPC